MSTYMYINIYKYVYKSAYSGLYKGSAVPRLRGPLLGVWESL